MGQGSILYPANPSRPSVLQVKSYLCRVLEKHFGDIRFLCSVQGLLLRALPRDCKRTQISLFKGQYFKVLQNGRFVFRSSVKGRPIGGRKKTFSGQSH